MPVESNVRRAFPDLWTAVLVLALVWLLSGIFLNGALVSCDDQAVKLFLGIPFAVTAVTGIVFALLSYKSTTLFSVWLGIFGVSGFAVVIVPNIEPQVFNLAKPVSLNSARTELTIHGNLPSNLGRAIEGTCALDHCKRVQRIVLNSKGGNVDGAVGGVAALRTLGLHTAVVPKGSVCASACVLLWASAEDASLEPGGALAMHQFYNTETRKPDRVSERGNQTAIAMLKEQGLTPEVVAFGQSEPPESTYYVTSGDLARMRAEGKWQGVKAHPEAVAQTDAPH
jgi:hypothetical protein